MQTSQLGIETLMQLEACILHAYRDIAGIWTIGVGHTRFAGPPDPEPGMVITRGKAIEILTMDLKRYERDVSALFTTVPQSAFDGAVIFDFNTGAFLHASWPRLYLAGHDAASEEHLKFYNRASGNIVPGLIHRRAIEADMIFRDKYPPGIEPANSSVKPS